MSDPRTKKTVHLKMISEEYNAAVEKHPKFCDDITVKSPNAVRNALRTLREKNGEPPYHADDILYEEIVEALEAYQQGDKAHAMQELAQCGAVILRMMEFVQNEMEEKR